MIEVVEVSPDKAEELCRKITAGLPEYFGLPECNEAYAIGVRSRVNLAAKKDGDYIGLISLDFPYPNNANIYWLAVLHAYQGQGFGRTLLDAACRLAKSKGANTVTVETLSPQESDKNYLKTYQFYQANGFVSLFNVKPQGYEWTMVYMVRDLNQRSSDKFQESGTIRPLSQGDIPILVKCFAEHHWPKPQSTFDKYLQEQEAGERLVWVAHVDDQLAGYVTLAWQSKYKSFRDQRIPEIMDLNVLPPYRNRGIGSKLLATAENTASTKSPIVGIGVGLYEGYGAAQKLYIKRGYIPDGHGITSHYQPIDYGKQAVLDDDLVLWFMKKYNAPYKMEHLVKERFVPR